MFYNLGEGYYSQKLKEQQYTKAVELYRLGRYVEAVELLRRAVVDCYLPAELYLGYCHSHGLGVEQSDLTALRWYRYSVRGCKWAEEDVERIGQLVCLGPNRARFGFVNARNKVI